MDLRSRLAKRIYGEEVKQLASLVQTSFNDREFDEFFQLLYDEEARVAENVAWIMSCFNKDGRKRLISKKHLIIAEVMNTSSTTKTRLLLTTLLRQPFSKEEITSLGFKNFEIIFSNPKSPASVITKKIKSQNQENLQDSVLGVNFNYATESFFQINLPVYEQALRDMKKFIDKSKPTVDLYSGVGSIGLTIGAGDLLTLVEINEPAVKEMQRNITKLGREKTAKAILSPSEKALDFIKKGANLIVDPPRAGMNREVCEKILEIEPERVIYLSCNPTTQARDIAILSKKYEIIYARGYNFFPRTPHIENLIILEIKNQ